MKQIAKSLVLVGAMVAAGSASASWIDELCPYIGVDYKQTWLKGKGFWHNKIAKSYPGATLYVGTKFNECFGAEIGYSWSGRKHKTGALYNYGNWNGSQYNNLGWNGNNTTVRTSTRFNSFHLDLNGYYPLADCWELIGSIGIASMKPKVSASINRNDCNTNRFTNVQALNRFNDDSRFLQSAHGKSKGVWRLGAGAQFLFTECVGVRGMLRWENTSALRVGHNRNDCNNNNYNLLGNYNRHHHDSLSRKVFKDAWSLALGLFVKF